MQKTVQLCIFALTGVLWSSISVSDAVVKASGDEIIHSIFDYDVAYQERARAAVEEMMYHWSQDSYVRRRPVRIIPNEVLEDESSSDGAMPEMLQLTVFPDVILSARKTRYTYIDKTGDSIWEGVVQGNDLSRVEITIVDTTDKLLNGEERIGFVIRIWHPPKHFYVLGTEDPDVYVAIEGRAAADEKIRWAPNN